MVSLGLSGYPDFFLVGLTMGCNGLALGNGLLSPGG